MFRSGLYVYHSWFTFDQYQTKTIILWYDVNDLVKTALLSLIQVTGALGSKIVFFFSCKCQQKEWSSGERFITSRLEKCQNVKIFTVLRLVQKIDHWLALTSSITFIRLLVASKRTVLSSFRGKYAASFSDYVINYFYFLKCISVFLAKGAVG